jgi:hypothetical protein
VNLLEHLVDVDLVRLRLGDLLLLRGARSGLRDWACVKCPIHPQ